MTSGVEDWVNTRFLVLGKGITSPRDGLAGDRVGVSFQLRPLGRGEASLLGRLHQAVELLLAVLHAALGLEEVAAQGVAVDDVAPHGFAESLGWWVWSFCHIPPLNT